MSSQVVLGVVASHSTLMNTHWQEVESEPRAHRFRDGLKRAREAVAAAEPDVAVIVGSNHFRGFWLDLLPAFTIGVGEVVASGESGTPKGPQRTDPGFAQALAGAVVERDFDLAFSARMQIDHGQTHAVQYLLDGVDVPIVPLVVNVFAPPLPSMPRCLALGHALGAAVAELPGDRRVVVIGSGGLSHELPFPDWRAPVGEDEEFLVQAWLNGREDWQSYDPRRREIVRAAAPGVNPLFDAEFLSLLEAGRSAELAQRTSAELEAEAGNGAQEIRTWLVTAAACGHGPATTLAYEPMPEWLTGMGVALIEPAALDPAVPDFSGTKTAGATA